MKRFVFLLGMMGAVFLVQGQVDQPPVVMASAVLAARPGTEVLIAVTAEILEGWAIQAHMPTSPNLIPTTLSFDPVPDLSFGEIIYPEPVPKKVAFAKEKLLVYTGLVVFLVPLKVAEGAQPGLRVLRGKLSYQPCTESYCRFPEELEVSFLLLVVT